MSLPDGQPLSRILRGVPLPPETVISWGVQLARALARIHAAGAIHRDLKPSNIMVDHAGHVWLSDSGLPGLANEVESLVAHEDIAGVSVLLGAPQYMPPEQIRGEPVDIRSNIFSMGVLLYEMATGRRPFEGSTSEQILDEVLRGRPLSLRALVPDIPPRLEEVVLRSLEPSRAARQQTMETLTEDLLSAKLSLEPSPFEETLPDGADPSPEVPSETPAFSEGRTRKMALVGLAMIALLLGGFGLAFLRLAAPLDPSTVLILPLDSPSQERGGGYLARSVSEAIAINLAQAPNLRILPVPQPNEVRATGTLERAEAAARLGAGRLLMGSVTRDGKTLAVSLNLVDAAANRILWGEQVVAGEDELASVAAAAARKVGKQLDAGFPSQYDYVGSLTADPKMAASPETTRALAALRQGDIGALMSATGRLLQEFPEQLDAQVLRAHALMLVHDANPTSENRQRLERELRKLDELDPANPYSTFYRAHLSFTDGEPHAAFTAYEKLLSRDDLTPAVRAWILRHRAYLPLSAEDSHRRNPLEDLEEALRLDPANARTFHILSETLLAQGRAREAETRARQAVALMPSYWRHHQTLGLALSAQGRWDDAAAELTVACEQGATQAACALQALALWRLDDKPGAEKAAAHAASLTDEPTGQYNLACFFALSGDKDQALTFLEQAVENGFSEVDPSDDPDLRILHDEPRFKQIAAKRSTRHEARPPQ